MKPTDLNALEYLRSMALTEEPSEVHGMDGGALWRIADDHFVILICRAPEHPDHMGPEYLRRVLPPTWDVFHKAGNTDEEFEAWHYGPVTES